MMLTVLRLHCFCKVAEQREVQWERSEHSREVERWWQRLRRNNVKMADTVDHQARLLKPLLSLGDFDYIKTINQEARKDIQQRYVTISHVLV